nr:hypothetical protein [Clostridioides difficile]
MLLSLSIKETNIFSVTRLCSTESSNPPSTSIHSDVSYDLLNATFIPPAISCSIFKSSL